MPRGIFSQYESTPKSQLKGGGGLIEGEKKQDGLNTAAGRVTASRRAVGASARKDIGRDSGEKVPRCYFRAVQGVNTAWFIKSSMAGSAATSNRSTDRGDLTHDRNNQYIFSPGLLH